MLDKIEDAICDLREGRCVIVVDDENRENEGDLMALADRISSQTVNFMISHGRGLLCVPLTAARAEELGLEQMARKNTESHGTAFTVSVDCIKCSTGISAEDRASTIEFLANPNKSRNDFRRPGHIFPLIARSGGVFERAGHTEAAVDLARLCGAVPVGVICEILKPDGTMARLADLRQFAQTFNLKIISIADLIDYRIRHERIIEEVAATRLPTSKGIFKLIAYTSILDNYIYLALVKGEIDPATPTLVRIHSECLTGDVFHSTRCDCGRQLELALELIQESLCGVFIYMRQEGRGIGLIEKLRSYALQDAGADTVEANILLGHPPDSRKYYVAIQILRELGVQKVRLMTNNPLKVSAFEGSSIKVVERVPLEVPPTPDSIQYLFTKQLKLGHILPTIEAYKQEIKPGVKRSAKI